MFEKMNILETVFCRIILQNQNTIVLSNPSRKGQTDIWKYRVIDIITMVIIKMNHKLLSKNNFAGKKSQHAILNHVSSEQNNCIRNWYDGPKYWSKINLIRNYFGPIRGPN